MKNIKDVTLILFKLSTFKHRDKTFGLKYMIKILIRNYLNVSKSAQTFLFCGFVSTVSKNMITAYVNRRGPKATK